DELELFCCVLSPTNIQGIWAAGSLGKCKTITGVNDYNDLPTEFSLMQNYPNPFNPSTTIKYHVPVSGFVKLNVFDVLGREIAVLVNEFKQVGDYRVTFNAGDLPAGVYSYRIQSGKYQETRNLILLK
ncbi:MAG: T9SS type A sorting domain-containing protein, partial [Bacteroidota bacterium]